jgi:hypothetical protein
MNDVDILYHGEARLADWGESRAGGKWIKVFLPDLDDQDPLDAFRGLDTQTAKRSGHIFNITITQGDIIQMDSAPEEKNWGKLASKLYANGFFHSHRVLPILGSDTEFLDWIRLQKSAYSDQYSEFIDAEGRCEAAHVRRAGEAGTAYKPPYSAIPLTHEEHKLQHASGESALGGKEWFDKMAAGYRISWGKHQLCKIFDVTGTRHIPPWELLSWAIEHGIESDLPKEYRDYETGQSASA